METWDHCTFPGSHLYQWTRSWPRLVPDHTNILTWLVLISHCHNWATGLPCNNTTYNLQHELLQLNLHATPYWVLHKSVYCEVFSYIWCCLDIFLLTILKILQSLRAVLKIIFTQIIATLAIISYLLHQSRIRQSIRIFVIQASSVICIEIGLQRASPHNRSLYRIFYKKVYLIHDMVPVHKWCLIILIPLHWPALTRSSLLNLLQTNLIVTQESILTCKWSLKMEEHIN